MIKRFTILFLLLVFIPLSTVSAHRSGCHRWHSCPSDTGSYVCGDLGYTSGCPKTPIVKPKVSTKKISVIIPTAKTISPIPDKKCLAEALKVGKSFLISKGYKENKDGSWTNSKGSYPTSKISNDLDTKQTDVYFKCLEPDKN